MSAGIDIIRKGAADAVTFAVIASC